MQIDSLLLGAPLPPHEGTRSVFFAGDLDGLAGNFYVTLEDSRVATFEFTATGAFEALAAAFDRIEATLGARHGEPSRRAPRDDDRRHVPLYEEGLPCDRYWILRDTGWEAPRASVVLAVVWPADIQLTLSARR